MPWKGSRRVRLTRRLDDCAGDQQQRRPARNSLADDEAFIVDRSGRVAVINFAAAAPQS
jgi:hypothetical protein